MLHKGLLMLFTGVSRSFQDNVNSFRPSQVPLRLLKNSRLAYNCQVFLSLFQGTCILESNISDLNHPNKMMETSESKGIFQAYEVFTSHCLLCVLCNAHVNSKTSFFSLSRLITMTLRVIIKKMRSPVFAAASPSGIL